jgi:hypothetical protein
MQGTSNTFGLVVDPDRIHLVFVIPAELLRRQPALLFPPGPIPPGPLRIGG